MAQHVAPLKLTHIHGAEKAPRDAASTAHMLQGRAELASGIVASTVHALRPKTSCNRDMPDAMTGTSAHQRLAAPPALWQRQNCHRGGLHALLSKR